MKWNMDLSFLKSWLGAIGMIGLGIAMFVNPHLVDDATADGRKKFFKQIIIAIWGYPGGVVLVLAGGYIIYSELRAIAARKKD